MDESWINPFLQKQNLIIPVTKKYNLVNPGIELANGKCTLQAEIREKENTAIRLTCIPIWDVGHQRIAFSEIEINLLSKNILLKSAGWFAKTFMSSKIDKKIEEAANDFYTQQIQKAIDEGIRVPIQKDGSATVLVKSITINEMIFADQQVIVKAMVEGHWKLSLLNEK